MVRMDPVTPTSPEQPAPDVTKAITGWALSAASPETLRSRLTAIVARLSAIAAEYDLAVSAERSTSSTWIRRESKRAKRLLMQERGELETERAAITAELGQRREAVK